MPRIILLFISSILFINCHSNSKKVPSNTLNQDDRLQAFSYENSTFIKKKNYRVYLPLSYTKATEKSYPVLYMMDNQNLFEAQEAYGGAAWDIDEVADSLVSAGAIPEVIIVGIDHASENRFFEYIPQQPMMELPEKLQKEFAGFDKIYSDKFLQFLVKELKPTIDSSFRTLSNMENTFIGGSSMGGLISMYATCEYPEVFNGAMCLSTHWIINMDGRDPAFGNAIVDYFDKNIPSNKRWYFDHGTVGLDQYYEPFQQRVNQVLAKKYDNKELWLSKKFEGHDHNERFWNERLAIPMTFLLTVND